MNRHLICDVCGDPIANAARSWPRANPVPLKPIKHNGRIVKEAHLGCYRLVREYGQGDR